MLTTAQEPEKEAVTQSVEKEADRIEQSLTSLKMEPGIGVSR